MADTMKTVSPRPALVMLAACCALLTGCGGSDPEPQADAQALPTSTTLQSTARPLDVGIEGDGLFVLQAAPGGERRYSRFGRLDIDRDGYLVHADGARVLGPTGFMVAGSTAADTEPVRVAWSMSAQATRRLGLSITLDVTEPVDPWPEFDPDDPATYNNATSGALWGDDGQARFVTLFFRNLAGMGASGWQSHWVVHAVIDGRNTGIQRDWHFAPDGKLPADQRTLLLPAVEIGLPHDVVVDFEDVMEWSGSFGVWSFANDGHAAGLLQSVSIEADGRLVLGYDNGVAAHGGQILLARFTVADRLVRTGGSSWTCGAGCRAPALGTPGTALLGPVRAGTLNTDY